MYVIQEKIRTNYPKVYIVPVSTGGISNFEIIVSYVPIGEKDKVISNFTCLKNNSISTAELNSRIVVLENIYMSDSSMVTPLAYCTTAFPNAESCPECINQTTKVKECYFIENDRIKTSFASGKVCLSYKAFPTDEDCYPLVPDDISFKEAMFWYVYKKMLLGGETPVENGINYVFAEQQWKYYCTQARNAANYPDIDRYESFMNQWVRLIPNINRHSAGFENLGTRETLHRGSANTYGL